jgi:hypothetical protein
MKAKHVLYSLRIVSRQTDLFVCTCAMHHSILFIPARKLGNHEEPLAQRLTSPGAPAPFDHDVPVDI